MVSPVPIHLTIDPIIYCPSVCLSSSPCYPFSFVLVSPTGYWLFRLFISSHFSSSFSKFISRNLPMPSELSSSLSKLSFSIIYFIFFPVSALVFQSLSVLRCSEMEVGTALKNIVSAACSHFDVRIVSLTDPIE